MKTTLTELANSSIVRNMARIIDLLQWNKEEYTAYIYNSGLEYLRAYMSEDEQAIAKLETRAEFWNWWKNLFNARNEVFVNEWDGLEDSIIASDLKALFFDLHNPKMLACEISPSRIVYPKDFTIIKMEMA